MKRLLFLFLAFSPLVSFAQIIAGFAPSGGQIININDSIIAPSIGTGRDTMSIDFDCDSSVDMLFVVKNGAPVIDAPHILQAYVVDTNFQMCWIDSMPPGSSRVKWYDYNDTMNCSQGYLWKNSNPSWNDEVISYGGFGSYLPTKATDSFIAIRKRFSANNYQYGWVNVTFNFQVNSNPFVLFNSFTAFCIPNSTINYHQSSLFELYPSLTNNILKLSSQENYFTINILNPMGQTVYKAEFNQLGQHNISLSSLSNGHYFVRYESEKGSQVIRIQKN